MKRRSLLRSLGGGVALASAGLAAATDEPIRPSSEGEELVFANGPLELVVEEDPFRMHFRQESGSTLRSLESDGRSVDAYGSLSFSYGPQQEVRSPVISYGENVEAPGPWFHATHVDAVDGATVTLATTDPTRAVELEVYEVGDGGLQVDAEPADATGVTTAGASFLRAGDDERYLGFGERNAGPDMTGEVVKSWCEEGAWSAGDAQPYVEPAVGEDWQGPPPFDGSTNYPIPWLLSSRGYGFLLDSTYYNEYHLATDYDDAWHVRTAEPSLQFRVYGGPTPSEVLGRFTDSIGRQPDPAEWFFGPWFQPTGEDAETYKRRWREWDVPVTVAQWYGHYLPCGDHVGERERRRELVSEYHDLGYKITTYVNSFVCNGHPHGAYDEGDENGYFVRTEADETYPVSYAAYLGKDAVWHGIVDFTDDAATVFWQDLIGEAIEDGFDGWMEDFGEYVPPDARTSDGRSGAEIHNRYPTLYHRASHEFTWPRRGRDFAQYVRAGYTRTAPYARIVWGGDPSEDYSQADGLDGAVGQGLSMGLSGIGYWGSDVGGFHSIFHGDRVDEELLIRWLQLGAFSGIMRTQSEGWTRPTPSGERSHVWDEDVRPVWRKYCKLRTQLFPYIWDAAGAYRESGLPIMRHPALGYPEDEGVFSEAASHTFLFGDDLLVAPVVEEGARTREVYLPDDEWVDFWSLVEYDADTGAFRRAPGRPEHFDGASVVEAGAPLERIPVFVRSGAVLELLPADVDTLADTDVAADVVRLQDRDDRRRIKAPESGR